MAKAKGRDLERLRSFRSGQPQPRQDLKEMPADLLLRVLANSAQQFALVRRKNMRIVAACLFESIRSAHTDDGIGVAHQTNKRIDQGRRAFDPRHDPADVTDGPSIAATKQVSQFLFVHLGNLGHPPPPFQKIRIGGSEGRTTLRHPAVHRDRGHRPRTAAGFCIRYEAGLRRRGSLTLWLTPEALLSWRSPKRTTCGGHPRYADLAIETALMLGLVFGLRLRQAEGLLSSVLQLMGLDRAVPDHTTLSRRASISRLPDRRQGRRFPGDGPVHVLIDSTGLEIYGAGQWLEEKHGARSRRSW
jgi:hypothetical protein